MGAGVVVLDIGLGAAPAPMSADWTLSQHFSPDLRPTKCTFWFTHSSHSLKEAGVFRSRNFVVGPRVRPLQVLPQLRKWLDFRSG